MDKVLKERFLSILIDKPGGRSKEDGYDKNDVSYDDNIIIIIMVEQDYNYLRAIHLPKQQETNDDGQKSGGYDNRNASIKGSDLGLPVWTANDYFMVKNFDAMIDKENAPHISLTEW